MHWATWRGPWNTAPHSLSSGILSPQKAKPGSQASRPSDSIMMAEERLVPSFLEEHPSLTAYLGMSTPFGNLGVQWRNFPLVARWRKESKCGHTGEGQRQSFPSPDHPLLLPREVLPRHLKGLQKKYNETDVDFFSKRKKERKSDLPDVDSWITKWMLSNASVWDYIYVIIRVYG